jgi:AbrB family looped-hinge helix DNA binding protein
MASALTRVSSKGQVVIPIWARRQLGIQPGDQLQVAITARNGERTIILRATSRAEIERVLQKGYDWLEHSGENPVEALHKGRRGARVQERRRRRR